MMKHSMYHATLRISALTLALVLLFTSGIFSPVTKQLTQDTSNYLATAIGMNAAVLPNEFNTLNTQLEESDKEITQREIAVSLKEQSNPDVATFILSAVLFILLVLILLNYALDYMRSRKRVTNTLQNEQGAALAAPCSLQVKS